MRASILQMIWYAAKNQAIIKLYSELLNIYLHHFYSIFSCFLYTRTALNLFDMLQMQAVELDRIRWCYRGCLFSHWSRSYHCISAGEHVYVKKGEVQRLFANVKPLEDESRQSERSAKLVYKPWSNFGFSTGQMKALDMPTDGKVVVLSSFGKFLHQFHLAIQKLGTVSGISPMCLFKNLDTSPHNVHAVNYFVLDVEILVILWKRTKSCSCGVHEAPTPVRIGWLSVGHPKLVHVWGLVGLVLCDGQVPVQHCRGTRVQPSALLRDTKKLAEVGVA